MEGAIWFLVGFVVFCMGMVMGNSMGKYHELDQFKTGALVHTEHFICSTDDISNCDYYDVYVVASKYDTRFTEPHVNLGKDGVGISFSGANTIASSKRVK